MSLSMYTSPAHFQSLRELDPIEICKGGSCRIVKDGGNDVFLLDFWGVEYVIDPVKERIAVTSGQQPLHEFTEIFLLHYLIDRKSIEPVGEWISEKDMKGGVTFFRGPHVIPGNLLAKKYGNDLETFGKDCESFGGSKIDMGDVAYKFELLPDIHIAVLYWIGDEDFPAEAKVLYDKSLLDLYALDVIFALAITICDRFVDGVTI